MNPPRRMWLVAPFFFATFCVAQDSGPPPAVTSPQAAGAGERIVAKVNGAEIPASRLEQRVKMTLNRASRNSADLTEEELKALRSQTLDTLVDEEILHQACDKSGIRISDQAVDDRLEAMEALFASREGYARSLAEQGMSASQAREQIRQNLAIEELIKTKVTQKVSVSEEEIARYYETNREKLRRAESAHALEIFVPLRRGGNPQDRTRARQALEVVLREAQGGRDFSALAREFSQGPSAASGGDIGWLTQNGPRPLLAAAALRLRPGEISDVVETPGGLHLLKVLEIKPAGDVTLEEARARIEEKLREEKGQAALQRFLSDLKSGARIEIVAATP